ncbi:MAG: carbohydrate kinase family protein [Patescibacteria group bacterium]
MSTFLAAGSIAFDTLLQYDGSFVDGIDVKELDRLSVGYVTRHLVRHFGGTAANIAWNLRLLNQDVLVAASVGNDAEKYLERLRLKGVNISLVREDREDVTPQAIVATDTGERQITFYHPGADRRTETPDLAPLKSDLSYVCVSPHSVTSMMGLADACQRLAIPYLFDPGQQSLQFSRDDLRRIVKGSAALTVNAYEWGLLSDVLAWDASEVLEFTDLLVVTHGEHGFALQTKKESIVIDAVPAKKLVNPTGAGDAFRAGLLTGLAHGWDMKDAGKLGAALASFVIEIEGTQLEEFHLDDLYERAERAYGEKLPMLG